MKKTLFGLLVLTALTAGAQTEVTSYRPGVTAEGVTYFLPRTALRVVVTTERTDYTPGDFCDYADLYLHLSGVSSQRSTTWRIKDVIITSFGIPDTAKVFSIRLKDKTVAPLVSLTDAGILLSINTEADEKPVPYVLPEAVVTDNKLNGRSYMNEDILSATSTAKMAELTASEIYDIRDSRNSLTRGEADNLPKDGAQLKLMLDQLDRQNEALTQLFKGSEKTTVQSFAFIIDPSESIARKVLFRFSSKLGVLDSDDLAGAPVYFSVTDQKTVPVPTAEEGNAKQPFYKMNLKKKEENGVRYNVPSRALVQVFDADKNLAEGDFSMGQFGNVELLSTALFNKKTTTKVTFRSADGSINRVDINPALH
jgi:hypothetical protein